ncbi:unnamed protein product, partial [Amoebophrya sp. A120]|eukprot:GSA120T00020171001.1
MLTQDEMYHEEKLAPVGAAGSPAARRKGNVGAPVGGSAGGTLVPPPPTLTKRYLIAVGCAGTAMAGYDTAVVSGTIDFMAESLKFSKQDDTFQRTAVVAATTICAMLSAFAMLLSTTLQNWGRRPVLCLGMLLHISGTILCVIAVHFEALIVGRAVVGVGAGLIFVVLPMHLSECAPASSRGSTIANLDLFIVVGQILAALVNAVLQEVFRDNHDLSWRCSYAFIVAPAVVCLLLIFLGFIPESPRMLVLQGNIEEAKRSLVMLFGDDRELAAIHTAQAEERAYLLHGGSRSERIAEQNGTPGGLSKRRQQSNHKREGASRDHEAAALAEKDEDSEVAPHPQGSVILTPKKPLGAPQVDSGRSEVELAASGPREHPVLTLYRFWTLPGYKRLRTAMKSGLGLTVMNQLTGINTVMLFGATIVQEMGFSLRTAIWATVALTVTQAGGVVLAVVEIDSAGGRRQIALRSCALVFLSLMVLGIATSVGEPEDYRMLAISSLLLYLFAFGYGLSPLCWVYNAEVYPTSVRALCSGQAFLVNILCTSLVTTLFLPLEKEIGLGGVFGIFGGVALVGGMLIYLYLSETAGKTLEELEKEVLRSASTSYQIEKCSASRKGLRLYICRYKLGSTKSGAEALVCMLITSQCNQGQRREATSRSLAAARGTACRTNRPCCLLVRERGWNTWKALVGKTWNNHKIFLPYLLGITTTSDVPTSLLLHQYFFVIIRDRNGQEATLLQRR